MMEVTRDMTAREKLLEIERLAAEVQAALPINWRMVPLEVRLKHIRQHALDCIVELPRNLR